MAESLTESQEVEMQVESHAPYLKVWVALLVLTLIEYFYAMLSQHNFTALVLGLMFWAVIKASLVAWYFMHLKFEGKWVYATIVPACVFATIIILALLPDVGMPNIFDESTAEDEVAAAPLAPGVLRA